MVDLALHITPFAGFQESLANAQPVPAHMRNFQACNQLLALLTCFLLEYLPGFCFHYYLNSLQLSPSLTYPPTHPLSPSQHAQTHTHSQPHVCNVPYPSCVVWVSAIMCNLDFCTPTSLRFEWRPHCGVLFYNLNISHSKSYERICTARQKGHPLNNPLPRNHKSSPKLMKLKPSQRHHPHTQSHTYKERQKEIPKEGEKKEKRQTDRKQRDKRERETQQKHGDRAHWPLPISYTDM